MIKSIEHLWKLYTCTSAIIIYDWLLSYFSEEVFEIKNKINKKVEEIHCENSKLFIDSKYYNLITYDVDFIYRYINEDYVNYCDTDNNFINNYNNKESYFDYVDCCDIDDEVYNIISCIKSELKKFLSNEFYTNNEINNLNRAEELYIDLLTNRLY